MLLLSLLACEDPTYAELPSPSRELEGSFLDTASGLEDEEEVSAPDIRGMVLIRAQTAELGCTSGQSDCDEREGVYTVTLQHDFWMASHEFTRGEWREITGEDPMPEPACDDCPVGMVTWHEVARALNTLSARDGLEPCYYCEELPSGPFCWSHVDPFNHDLDPYQCDGYRLPTEAEWEVAARCGEDLVYAGSNELDDVGWVLENSDGAQPVGQKAPNACGLYDMSGNVFEWNHDWYVEDLVGQTLVDPVGPIMGSDRNARGGAYDFAGRLARVSYRDRCRRPDMTFEDLGFRVARTVVQP